MKKITFSMLIVASTYCAFSSSAQAQATSLGNGVTLSTGASQESYNSVNLGSTAGYGWVTQMPMSLSYTGVDLNITFSGASGVAARDLGWNPAPGSNYFNAGGSVDFQFSTAQSYFGMAWSSPDSDNLLNFYKGSQLIATIGGEQFRSVAGVPTASRGAYAEFNFTELQYDRVVASNPYYMTNTAGPPGGLEFGDVRFAAAPEPAPVPLGGMGGLVAFFAMVGARRRGLLRREAAREANPFRKFQPAA